MFILIFCFQFSRNKNTENVFLKNEILLFLIFGSFEKIFSRKIFLKIQPNAFLLPFSIFNKNENRQQLNQTLI